MTRFSKQTLKKIEEPQDKTKSEDFFFSQKFDFENYPIITRGKVCSSMS